MALVRAPRLTNHHFQPDSLVTQELVLSLFVESITREVHRNWFSQSSDTALYKVLPSQNIFTRQSFFLSFFILSFIFITHFLWACGSLRELQNKILILYIYLLNNSFISSWISAKYVSALLPCMLYLLYYVSSA